MKNPNKWLMFIVLLVSAIMVSMSQLKISAVLPDVAAMLNVDMVAAAFLMSLFTLAGIVLSIPGAAVMTKIGPKKTLLILMFCLVLGNVLGALTDIFAVVLVSRIIEGISYALIITVGITLISTWFVDGGQATATGIFQIFAPVAIFTAMNLSLVIMNDINIKALWWLTAAASAVCFFLVLFFIKDAVPTGGEDGAAPPKASLAEAFKNPAAMIICVGHLFLSFFLFAFITCYPQLFAFYGLEQDHSNFLTSLNGLVGIPVCIIAGIVVEKTGKPFVVAVIGAIGCILLGATVPMLFSGVYELHVIASAIFPGGLVMTSIFIIIPRISKSPVLIGLTMGILNTMYYIGVFASTPLITALSDNNTNWVAPSIALVVSAAAVLVCMILANGLAKKQALEK